jgi:amino acid transporter
MEQNGLTSVNLNEKPVETRLKPVLGFTDLVFFYIVAIFGVRLVLAAAAAGPSIVFYIIISLPIFFVPLGLTVTDLSKQYPVEGGIYIWSKKAFGDFHGYITA